MSDLWEVEGGNLDIGYVNIREASSRAEIHIREALDAMWATYAPYADPDFKEAFARDPAGRFWEMHLGCKLMAGGKTLLAAVERKREGGQPDICVLDEGCRIWIEAIAPEAGADGPDQVRGPKPINEGGGLAAAPVRQVQLRASSALLTKTRAIERYLSQGTIGPEDVRLIAVGVGRFGSLVLDEPLPLAMSVVFPLGGQYMTIDRESGALIEEGIHFSPEIARAGSAIPRTAFLDPLFANVSGLVWSRTGIGHLGQSDRPLTLVHNPLARRPMPQRWGVWDREFVTALDEDSWVSSDILAGGDTSIGA